MGRSSAALGHLLLRHRLGLVLSLITTFVPPGSYAWLLHARFASGGAAAVTSWLVLAPLVGIVTAVGVINLVAGYVAWVDERVWAPWQGRYHAFDDHPIRVVDDDGRPGFAVGDVHAMLRVPIRANILATFAASERWHDDVVGDVLSTAGLQRLLGKSTDARTRRFLAWAERDVAKSWAKRRAPDETVRAVETGRRAARH